VTPASIVPESYLLPYYAILRSIPNKLLGVLALFGSLLILLVLPFTDLYRIRGNQFRPFIKNNFLYYLAKYLYHYHDHYHDHFHDNGLGAFSTNLKILAPQLLAPHLSRV